MFYRLDVTQATFLIKDLIYQDNEQTFWEFDFRMALTKLPESVKLISPEEAAHLQKMAGQAIEEKYKREKEMESKAAWDVAQPAAPVEPVEEPEFDEEVKKLHEAYGITVEKSAIKEVRGNAKELLLEGYTLEDGTEINSEISFVSLGMLVYNELATALGAEVDERGFVKTNKKGETNIEGLYAIGDLQADTKKQIYTSWDMAVDALDDIDNKIRRILRTQTQENLGG